MKPRLSPEERTERRREAALKGVRTKASKARINEFLNDVAESVTYQARASEGRKVVERAQSIGREGDLYYTVHVQRWPRKPSSWTPEMIARTIGVPGRFHPSRRHAAARTAPAEEEASCIKLFGSTRSVPAVGRSRPD